MGTKLLNIWLELGLRLALELGLVLNIYLLYINKLHIYRYVMTFLRLKLMGRSVFFPEIGFFPPTVICPNPNPNPNCEFL